MNVESKKHIIGLMLFLHRHFNLIILAKNVYVRLYGFCFQVTIYLPASHKCYSLRHLKRLVFDQGSPVLPISESRGGSPERDGQTEKDGQTEILVSYIELEGMARYAGLLLAPAEGFVLWPRLLYALWGNIFLVVATIGIHNSTRALQCTQY